MKKSALLLLMMCMCHAAFAQIIETRTDHPTGYFDGYDGYASQSNMKYITVDGVLYSAYSSNSDYWTLVRYPANRPDATYTVHSNCYRIGRGAFEGARNLTVINIPRQVRYIGDNAFDGCSSLRAINYGDTNSSHIENIEPDDNTDSDAREVARYNMAGQPCSPTEKGVQIVVFSDFTARTIVVD